MIDENVNGKTQVLAIIGNPISHTFSPIIHNTISKKLNKNVVYIPFKVDDKDVETAINGAKALNILGLNVTVPHKKSVIPYVISLDKAAQVVGAVNTLKLSNGGYVGYNTDCLGLFAAFKNKGVPLENQAITIVGAGGGAHAAAAMAAMNGARKINVVNRTKNNAILLAKHVNLHYNINIEVFTYDEIEKIEHDIIIQTTSVGLSQEGGVSPINVKSFFEQAKVAMDIIYSPWQTEFLNLAKSAGCLTFNGFDMLIYQAIAAYEIWFDMKFDAAFTEDILIHLREYFLKNSR